jgi:hypothetical protein
LTNSHDATIPPRFLTKEVDDVRQLEERTNLIRFGTNAEGIVDDWNYNATLPASPKARQLARQLVNNFVLRTDPRRFKRSLDKALSGEETSKYVLECTFVKRRRLKISDQRRTKARWKKLWDDDVWSRHDGIKKIEKCMPWPGNELSPAKLIPPMPHPQCMPDRRNENASRLAETSPASPKTLGH